MGWDRNTGLWLGDCPTAAFIDKTSCCLTLNIAPSLFSVVFFVFMLGCTSKGWSYFFVFLWPAVIGFVAYVCAVDSEPCLIIGLVRLFTHHTHRSLSACSLRHTTREASLSTTPALADLPNVGLGRRCLHDVASARRVARGGRDSRAGDGGCRRSGRGV